MTTANIITVLRIGLIPIFMVLSGLGYDIAAVVLFVVASATDALDGYIARKYNQISNFGKFVDPLADKLLVMSALLIFTGQGLVPAWAVTIILAREFTVTSLRMVAAAQGVVIQAVASGKLKTLSQLVCIVVLLCGFGGTMLGGISVAEICTWVMVLVAIISGYDYIAKNFTVVRDGFSGKDK